VKGIEEDKGMKRKKEMKKEGQAKTRKNYSPFDFNCLLYTNQQRSQIIYNNVAVCFIIKRVLE
jgi:hypothetical protein